MQKIKNILLCGLGGVGCVCATQIKDSAFCNLKILVDKERYARYKDTKTTFNGKIYDFDYILPDSKTFKADLIIIATKDDGLKFAIDNIKNFVSEETIIISVLNGIHSEKEIAKIYGWENVLISFYIGNSCIREGRNITQDGNYEFFIGDRNNKISKNLELLSDFFTQTKIKHKVSKHIMERYWKKFMVNVAINQVCTANNLTFKEVKKSMILVEEMKKLLMEVKLIAEKEGINNSQKLYDDTIKFLIEDFEDATPSMLQDLRAGRKTELNIFAGEVIRLGKKHNIQTPANKKIYETIKTLEEIKN